ncbi:hypothetical protein MHH52_00655 [Paenibacillus sp. FSL K6-0276]
MLWTFSDENGKTPAKRCAFLIKLFNWAELHPALLQIACPPMAEANND